MKYKKKHLLGKGGFGTVWMGIDNESGEYVLIKEIIITNEKRIKTENRIHRSATIPNLLPGKYVPQTLDVIYFDAEEEGQQVWIVSEYVDGQSLEKVDVENVLLLFFRLSKIFALFHREHICHRDIKAENILLSSDEKPVIIDFDLACVLNAPHKYLACDTLKGATSKYLAPEIFSFFLGNSDIKTVDWKKGDVYSLGVLVYYLVNGREFPFYSKNQDELYEMVLHDPVPAFQTEFPEIDSIVRSMLHKDPNIRPTMNQIYQALKKIISSL